MISKDFACYLKNKREELKKFDILDELPTEVFEAGEVGWEVFLTGYVRSVEERYETLEEET